MRLTRIAKQAKERGLGLRNVLGAFRSQVSTTQVSGFTVVLAPGTKIAVLTDALFRDKAALSAAAEVVTSDHQDPFEVVAVSISKRFHVSSQARGMLASRDVILIQLDDDAKAGALRFAEQAAARYQKHSEDAAKFLRA